MRLYHYPKKNGYNIPFVCYDGKNILFEDNSFDVVIIWAQTFGLLYGDEYKNSFLKECRRVLKKGGFLSFSGHDYQYLTENYPQIINDRAFYPYDNSDIYWETFSVDDMINHAKNANFTILSCERGEIYKLEDGVVLHCLCRK